MPSAVIATGPVPRRLGSHAFEVTAAIGWFLVGLTYLTSGQAVIASPVGQVAHPFDVIWSAGYVIAGPVILAAIIRRSTPLRVAGLSLLSAALLMQWVAAMYGGGVEPRDFVYLLYAGACILRAHLAAQVARRLERCGG